MPATDTDDGTGAAPEESTATQLRPTTAPTPPPRHQPGSIPAVPLAVAASNSAVAVSGAAVLAGPVAMMVLIGTACVAGGTMLVRSAGTGDSATDGNTSTTTERSRDQRRAERRAMRRDARTATSGPGGKPSGKSPGGRGRSTADRSGAGRPPAQRKSSDGRPGRSGRSAGRIGGATKTDARMAGAASRRAATAAKRTGSAAKGVGNAARNAGGAAKKAANAARRRLAGVQAARAAREASGDTRAERRRQATAARRSVGDQRRAERTTRRAAARAAAGKSTRSTGKATARRAVVRERLRTMRDAYVNNKVNRARSRTQTRWARRRLRRSSVRHAVQMLATSAALLPLAAAFAPFVWVARRSGLQVQNPALVAWGRLIGWARDSANEREDAIRSFDDELAAAHPAAAREPEIRGAVERPPHNRGAGPGSTPGGHTMSDTGGFDFADMAEDIHTAASNYDPDGAMKILALVDTMPDGLGSIAAAFGVLADKAAGDFPLNPVIADTLITVSGLLRAASAEAGDLPALFRSLHAHDIARHEDPRPGESKWNTE